MCGTTASIQLLELQRGRKSRDASDAADKPQLWQNSRRKS
jgi:hypothetical protein